MAPPPPYPFPNQEVQFRNPEMATRLNSVTPSRLIELLTEPPSRRAIIPSKYDEVLPYLISDTQPSSSAWSASDFQPEDEAALSGALSFQ